MLLPRRRARRRAPGGAPRSGRPRPKRRLPALAPMTMSDLLDGGFAIIKQAPATIIGLTAIFVIPIQLVAGFLGRGWRAGAGTKRSTRATRRSTSARRWAPRAPPSCSSWARCSPWSWWPRHRAARVRVVRGQRPHHRTSCCEARSRSRGRSSRPASWSTCWRRSRSSASGILPLAVMTWFLVTAPVIGAERVGPIARHAPLGAAREPPVLERARRRPPRLPRRAPLRLRHRAGAAGRVALPRHRGHRLGDPRRDRR